jgi:PAS domain S-box-containing protein
MRISTGGPQPAAGATFLRSIKTRVTFFTLTIFLLCIWSLAFYASRILQQNLQNVLSDQQYSTVSLVAVQINGELELRLRSLEDIASRISPAMINDLPSLQAFITNRSVLHTMFNGGLFVTRPDGMTIADYPITRGRIGLVHGARGEWLEQARVGKSNIGKPVIGRKTQVPIVPMAAPIRDHQGKVIGVLVGVIDLSEPNFLDPLLTTRYGEMGDFTLIAPQHKLVVTATNKDRILQPTPAPGVNPLYHRFAEGFSGSGITVDYRGVEVLASGRSIPVAGWLLVGRIPTAEVFAPLGSLLRQVLLATLFLTLLAGGLTWWLLRRELAPVLTTIKMLADLPGNALPDQPLPVARQDEVGALIGGFNRLLEALRQREEALKASEERYQSLFEQAGDGILILDTKGKILSVNKAFSDMHGYTVREMLCMGLQEINAADITVSRDRIREVLKGETLSFEVEHHHRDGHTFPLAVTAKLVSWRNDRMIMGTHRDLTEQKRLEEEQVRSKKEAERLAREEAALAEIGRVISSTLEIERVYNSFSVITQRLIPFDTLSVALIDSAKELVRIAYFSGTEIPERTVGKTLPLAGSIVEYMLSKGRAVIINVASNDALVRLYPSIKAAPSIQAGFQSIMMIPLVSNDVVIGALHFRAKKEGTYGEAELRLAEKIAMQIAGAIANAQLYADLQENRRVIRRLADEQAALAEISRVIGATLEIEMVYEQFGSVTRKLIPFDALNINLIDARQGTFGIAYYTGIAIPGLETGTRIPLAGTMTAYMLQRGKATIIDVSDAEELIRRHPGIRNINPITATFRSNMLVPLISNDVIIGMIHFRIAGERVYSEDDLRLAGQIGMQIAGAIANARLFTECRRAEQEQIALLERLARSEKMEALGTLAGGVAHDLNNVLGIVVGYSEMLLDSLDESSGLRSDVVKIMDAGNRSAAIVQDLLTLARRGVQTRKVIHLNTHIRDLMKTPEFEQILSLNPRVRIETDLDADLLHILGSPVHLDKSLVNLVSNAVEAMPDGGRLTIHTANQYLDKGIQGYDNIRSGDYAVLSVSDEGEGISANDLNHIFEPFYTKKVMGRSGTGLGLAVVWGTVKDHNGYVNVQSEVGRGTTFSLYFPITREELATEQASVPLADYIGCDEAILVVDDIREQRELASRMLGKLNYKVTSVASGEEAVEYLQTHTADLVLLDMIMEPGMDGLDTYKAILAIRSRQKAIIVSGFAETERVREAQALGAGGYVKKPYVLERLGLAVRKALEQEWVNAISKL